MKPSRLVFACAMTAFAAAALLCTSGASASEALPDYEPEQQLHGVLRSWGNNHMAGLIAIWQQGFSRYHPQLRFEDNLRGSAMAQWGLQEWVADLAFMGRQIWPYEYYGTYRRSYNFPVEIAVATGSHEAAGKSPALAVFVHEDNPLSRLTLEQLDGIFGAQRTGGWQGLDWVRDGVARGAEKNIRTWGQLGLKGHWATKEIVPYGPPSLVTGAVSYFQARVHGGADTRNEKLREYQDRAAMMRDLSRNRYGIGYAPLSYRTAQVKPLALADRGSRNYVPLTRETVADHSYPLTRSAYVYFTIDTRTGDLADPLVDPRVKEFLRYVLSRQGQQDVARAGGYLPLTAEMAEAQRATLENPPTGRVFRKDRR